MMRLTALALSVCALLAMPSSKSLRGVAVHQVQRFAPLRLTVEGEEKDAPVRLERADVQITVAGPLTQVTQTLVFRNPSKRVLEGELTFPLPEGAAVSGFALDVKGELVDAVPVEKEKARVVFEKEVRKGVDPGLLEQLEGNVFRTRIYPLPAEGTRTVRITYSTDKKSIPLRFGSAIPDGKVTVDVLGASQARVLVGSHPYTLARFGDRLTTEAVLENAAEQDVSITVPPTQEPVVVTESFTRNSSPRPETFFCISDTPPRAKMHWVAPRSVGIVWDASLSRRKADIAKELAVLAAHLAGKTLDAEVVVLRQRPEKPRKFRLLNGDSRELIAFLKAQPFDGGTALGSLQLPKHDYWLWFTDGFGNLGPESPILRPQQPIYAISTSASANTTLLRYLCEMSGGALSDGSNPEELGRPQVRLIGVEGEGALEVQWRDGLITGRLWRDETTLTLSYGLSGNQVLERRTVAVRKSAATAQGLIARQWAAQRAEFLALRPDENHEALLALGQAFNLVTPGTSLIVLESLEQYVEHNIAPPRTRPALYDAWLGREKTEKDTKRAKDERQLQTVLAQWNERTNWWKKDFPRSIQPREKAKDDRRYLPRQVSPQSSASASGRAAGSMAAGEGRANAPGMIGGMMGGGGRPRSGTPRDTGLHAESEPTPSTRPRRGAEMGRTTLASERVVAKKPEPESEGGDNVQGTAIKPWTPDAPYLKTLKAAGPTGAYAVYLTERESYAETPAFYLDCAEILLQMGRRDEGLRVLSSLADLQIEDAALLRVLAHRLAQLGEKQIAAGLFEKILRLRPEEPQSYRDLALVLADLNQPERAL